MKKLHILKITENNYQVFGVEDVYPKKYPPKLREIGNFILDQETNTFGFYPLGNNIWDVFYLKKIVQHLEKLNNERKSK
jgi:hypothetical protein